MAAECRAMAGAIREFALDRGWTDLAGLAEAVAAGRRSEVALLTANAADARALAAWLNGRGAVGASPLPIVTLDAVEVWDPAPFLAGRLLVAFTPGHLLDASAVDRLDRVLLARPPESWAGVLIGVERLASPDELCQIERGLARLLPLTASPSAPHPVAGSGARLYLWDEVPPAWLRERAAADAESVLRWLTAAPPADGSEELERAVLLGLIDAAEARLAAAAGAGRDPEDAAGGPGPEAARVVRACRELAHVRRHLGRRLESDAAVLRGELVAALHTVEQDLLAGLRAYLDGVCPPTRSAPTDAEAEAMIVRYLQAGGEVWRQRADEVLRAQTRATAADAEALLARVDWDVVNARLPRTDGTPVYPSALLAGLAPALPVGALGELRSARVPAGLDTGAVAAELVRLAIGGALVVGVATRFFGPVGLAAGIAVTVAAGSLRTHQRTLAAVEERARLAIGLAFSAAIEAVEGEVASAAAGTRRQLTSELRRIEADLFAGIAARPPAGEAPAAGRPETAAGRDQLRLAAWRRQLTAADGRAALDERADG